MKSVSLVPILLVVFALACGSGPDPEVPEVCGPGRVCPQDCTTDVQCPVGQVCEDAVCVNPAPTVTDYERCYLDGDCPAGAHCSLGVCDQDCARDEDCAEGTICTDRGRCAIPEAIGEPPPLEPPLAGRLVVENSEIDFGAFAEVRTLTLGNDGDGPLQVRLMSDAPWLSASASRITLGAGESVEVAVHVDRDFADVSTGLLTLMSEAGVRTVSAKLIRSLSGAYAGQVHLDAPFSLGGYDVAFEIEEAADGVLTGVVDAVGTPILAAAVPVEGASADGGGEKDVTLEIEVVGPPGSATNPRFGRTVRHRWRLEGALVGARRIAGEATLLIDGVVGSAPVALTGTFSFDRVGEPEGRTPEGVRPFELDAVAEPPWPACNTCPGGCTDDPTQDRASRLDAAFPFYPAFENDHYAVVEDCLETGGADCIQYGQAFCALKESYEAMTDAGAEPAELAAARSDFLDVLKGLTAYWSMVAVGTLVDVHEQAHLSPLSEQAAQLALARRRAARGLRADPDMTEMPSVLDPFVVELLHDAEMLSGSRESRFIEPGGDHDVAPGGDLLRWARALEVEIDGVLERARTLHRLGDIDPALTEVRRSVTAGFLDLAILGALFQAGGHSGEGLAPARERLAALGRLEATLASGLNAVGLDPEFVPMMQLAADPNVLQTNFELTLARAQSQVADLAEKETQLAGERAAFEQSVQQQQEEAARLVDQYDGQLRNLCGEGFEIDGAELVSCEGGQVAAIQQRITLAGLAVERAVNDEQILLDQVEIETRRLAQHLEIQEDLVEMTLANGERRRVLAERENSLESTRGAMDILGGFIGMAASQGNPAELAKGVFSYFRSAAELVIQQERAKIQAERDEIALREQVQVHRTQAEQLEIDTGARIESMLLQAPNLAIQRRMAVIELAQVVRTLGDTLAEARFVAERRAERARLASRQAFDPSDRIEMGQALAAHREAAQRARAWSYRATRALEYELNFSFAGRNRAIESHSAAQLAELLQDLDEAFHDDETGWRRPSRNLEVVSLRRDIMGIRGSITDPQTGEEVSAQERFRRYLLAPENWDGAGMLRFTFSTAPNSSRPLFSSNVFNDRIVSLKANLVGADLGSGTAFVGLSQAGLSMVRDRQGSFQIYRLGDLSARLQAGLNADILRDPVVPENVELFGRSVHAESWTLTLDLTEREPQHRDIDVRTLTDIELLFDHGAATIQ